jgi:hypothetical protein
MAGVPLQIKDLDDPTMIDKVMLSPEEDRIDLNTVHTVVWDRSTGLLLRLEQKRQHYVGLAIHGGLARMYPDYAHLPGASCSTAASSPTTARRSSCCGPTNSPARRAATSW